MKKILLLTWYDNNNYGTSLQAFALKSVVENPNCTGLMDIEGYEKSECVILRHKPEVKKSLENKLKKVFSPKSYLKKIEQYNDKKIRLKKADKFKIREKKFKDFNEKHFKFTGKNDIQDKKELSILAKDYDVFIAGSDQIWNPEALDRTYLMEWVDSYKKIISYGSSLSVNKIPEKFKDIYFKSLSRFDSLSIRDVACREELSQIVGKDICTVVDPVVLFGADALKECSKKSKILEDKEPYVFCYFLGDNKLYRKLVVDYAKKYNLKIKAIINTGSSYSSDRVIEDYAIWNVDPWDFVSLIENSEMVITDSFHATVVATLMKRQFFVFEKDASRPEQNNRIKEFLKKVNLEKRWAKDSINEIKISQKDWENAHKNLTDLRKKSLEYLMEALC